MAPLLVLPISLFTYVVSSHCYAEPKADVWSANLYLENDLFGGTDQNYTNGLRLSLISPNLASYRDDPALPPILNRVNNRLDRLFGFNKGLTRNVVVSFGQSIYTPADKQSQALIVDDRPYAGYLYFGLGYHSRSTDTLHSAELNIGMVGPSAAGEWAQNTVHDIRNIEKFNGWDNQLHDEPVLQLGYEFKRKRLQASLFDAGLSQDLITHIGAAFGSVAIYVNSGAEYRVGWHLPEDFGTSAVRPGGDNSAPGAGDRRLTHAASRLNGFHLFFAVDTRIVARDIFLDGNTWQQSHRVDKEHFVADVRLGVSASVKRWKLSYAQIVETKRFQLQQHHHEYGSLSISYTFW